MYPIFFSRLTLRNLAPKFQKNRYTLKMEAGNNDETKLTDHLRKYI